MKKESINYPVAPGFQEIEVFTYSRDLFSPSVI